MDRDDPGLQGASRHCQQSSKTEERIYMELVSLAWKLTLSNESL